MKLNGVREQSDKLLQLEQEVKRKDLTLKQVEAERSKDTNHYVAIEKDLHASNNKVQQLEQVKCWENQTRLHLSQLSLIYDERKTQSVKFLALP